MRSPLLSQRKLIRRFIISYDLSICSDEAFSEFAPATELRSFVEQLENVKPNGEWGFALGKGKSNWMEIDLEVVSDEGDYLGDVSPDRRGINCVRLHIPYSFLNDGWQQIYLPTALAISDYLHWPLVDAQTDETIIEIPPDVHPAKKPWWRFW